MTNIDTPRLCGGTFFFQILRTKKPSTITKAEGLKGEKDSVNNQRILEALIRFFYPSFKPTCDSTFKGDVSSYLACDKSEGTNLPFTRKYYYDTVAKFDDVVKRNFDEPLSLMEEFVDSFIDEDKCDAVCALLQTIIDDNSIGSSQKFYMGKMGVLSKERLAEQRDIILECFLLGIWHFIVTNRENNKLGKATFLEWTAEQGRGKKRIYISNIGCNLEDIKITRSNGVKIAGKKQSQTEAEYIDEDTEEYVSDGLVSPALHKYQTFFQQININSLTYFNGAAGSTQIQTNNGVIMVGGMQQPTVPSLPDNPKVDKMDYYHLVIGYEYGKRVIIDKSRAITEYISDDARRAFSLSNPEDMAQIPVLIMPEINDTTHEQVAITGMVTKVKTQDNGIVLYLQKGLSFPSNIITTHMNLFGICHVFELNRTHWTIKKINLQEAMEDAGIDL